MRRVKVMKRILAGAGVAAVLAMATGAGAADLGRRPEMSVKAPYAAPYFNWSGAYVGVSGGGAWGSSTWSDPGFGSAGIDVSGGLVGGTLGVSYQVQQWVFGLESDISWADIGGSTSAGTCAGVVCHTQNNWLGTVRGRVGVAFDRFLPYFTGGAAFGDIEANVAGFPKASETNVGWTIGGGFEWAFAPNLSAKVEYLYVDLGSFNCPVTSCLSPAGTATSVDFTTSIVRGGLNYRF
jgi:outer membrane immunogenic protein